MFVYSTLDIRFDIIRPQGSHYNTLKYQNAWRWSAGDPLQPSEVSWLNKISTGAVKLLIGRALFVAEITVLLGRL